jgi:1,2-diacylglycerol 3-alpha-glucosyltransferase
MIELDLIHTHTEFGAGILGKMVGKKMKIPVIHTYHTLGDL